MGRPGPLAATGAVVLGILALSEEFSLLPAAIAAYASVWWVLGLELSGPGSEDPR